MRRSHHLALPLALTLALTACTTTSGPEVVEADQAVRGELLAAVAALDGRWTGQDPTGEEHVTEFHVSSGGSAVREVMFPGDPHEMTNMYTLDGNALVMTHYCAGGNQPHMRATALEGNRLAFRADGVSDLKSADEVYMGEMTLVLVDADHIEQHWRALKAGAIDHETVFELTRVR